MKLAKLLVAMAGCLLLAIPSTTAFGQMKSSPTSGHNLLIIHGRNNPAGRESYGVWNTDQANFWGSAVPATTGNRWYVQWDAWNVPFDSFSGPEVGGEYLFSYAVEKLCNYENNQSCTIICHSDACPVVEYWLSKSGYLTSPLYIDYVIAAESVAGGSDVADSTASAILSVFWSGGWAPIDASITPTYVRGAYDHNHMQGVVIRGIGGTYVSGLYDPLKCMTYFPGQWVGTGGNQSCSQCPLGYARCFDDLVALHSTCGHNRRASFQNCNGNLPGTDQTDSAGTYEYHTWWIDDSGYAGPYSQAGYLAWDPGEHTYVVNHTDGKIIAVDEYSAAPYSLAP